jgi:hypothetical protein
MIIKKLALRNKLNFILYLMGWQIKGTKVGDTSNLEVMLLPEIYQHRKLYLAHVADLALSV